MNVATNKHRLSPCGTIAREADPDRFYAALFAPAAKREALFALIAFNHEIARLREVISEPLIGEMRLAWWHEVLDEIEAGRPARAHPVALGLDVAFHAARFSLDPLRLMIDARSFDLHNDPMPDIEALVSYARASGGGLARAMAESLAGSGDERVLAGAQAAGTSWALTGIIRSLRIHASRGQTFLPARELGARGIPPSSVFEGKVSQGLHVVIAEILARAMDELALARRARFGAALPAVMQCAQLPFYWRRMTSSEFDPFRSAIEPSNLSRLTRLLVASLVKKI